MDIIKCMLYEILWHLIVKCVGIEYNVFNEIQGKNNLLVLCCVNSAVLGLSATEFMPCCIYTVHELCQQCNSICDKWAAKERCKITKNMFGNLKLELHLLIEQVVWLITEFSLLAGFWHSWSVWSHDPRCGVCPCCEWDPYIFATGEFSHQGEPSAAAGWIIWGMWCSF
jgi:hypothetical protein